MSSEERVTEERDETDSEDEYARAAMDKLVKNNKLPLILDLDQTLVHCVLQDHLDSGLVVGDLSETLQFSAKKALYRVAFRPHLAKFIKNAKKLFELHIYTSGTREYAKTVLDLISHHLLDGEPVIQGKMVSRCDTGDANNKNLMFVVPGLENYSVIVDDNVYVWETWRGNVLQIYPFVHFKAVAKDDPKENQEQDQTSGEDPTTFQETDSYLNSMYNVLRDIHCRFFKFEEMNRRLPIEVHIQHRRKWVLSGTNLVFSGLFPVNVIPEQQRLWKNAQSFGAICSVSLTPQSTHLIAARPGTRKVHTALDSDSIYVVNLMWLDHSITHWVKKNELKYLLIKNVSPNNPLRNPTNPTKPLPLLQSIHYSQNTSSSTNPEPPAVSYQKADPSIFVQL